MAADFNKPTITGDAYVDVLGEIRAQFEVVSTMSYGDALNTKVGAVQFLDGSLQKWDGASFNVVPVSITGGGSGASTPAGARAAFNVNEKGTLGTQVRSNAESDALYVPQSRTISTSGALNGGNSLDSNISLTVDSATTSQQGVVQLFNGLNSTSTTQALTAAQGKVLGDMFRSEQLSAPVGDLTSGGAKISKAGNIVVISNNTSGAGFSHASASFVSSGALVPVGLRPSQNAINCYYAFGEVSYVVQVTPSGFLTFQYSQAGGSPLERTSTGSFTISYTI